MNPIGIRESGLLCDNPNCDWVDETIKLHEMKNWVNHPCPKCGDNVLTESDYANVETVLMAVNLAKTMSEEDVTKFMESSGGDLEEFNTSLNSLMSLTINTKGTISMELKDTGLKSLTFEKDPDSRWYIVLPEWEYDRSALEMVAGADILLDIIAQGENLVRVTVGQSPFDNFIYELDKVEETPEVGGAIYKVNGGTIIDMDIWLCDVTRFVYEGELPEKLFMR